MKTFPTDWKKSYWPEPRLGETKETRNACIRRLRGKNPSKRAGKVSLAHALEALEALVGS